MKDFFTKKRIAFLSVLCVSLLTLIILLIVPIGSLSHSCLIYTIYGHQFMTGYSSEIIYIDLSSPFTCLDWILVWQTVVFTLVGIIFVVFSALFIVELKKYGVFAHRPTKAERMQTQIDELQKQVDELKQDK